MPALLISTSIGTDLSCLARLAMLASSSTSSANSDTSPVILLSSVAVPGWRQQASTFQPVPA
jgi:hypothetical protein